MRLFPRLADVLGCAGCWRRCPRSSGATTAAGGREETFPVYFQLAIPSGAHLQRRPAVAARALRRHQPVRGHAARAGPRLAARTRRSGCGRSWSGSRPTSARARAARRSSRRCGRCSRRPTTCCAARRAGGWTSTSRSTSAGSCGGCCCRSSRASACRCWRSAFGSGGSIATIVDIVDHARPGARQVRRRVDGGRRDARHAVAAGAGREPGADVRPRRRPRAAACWAPPRCPTC